MNKNAATIFTVLFVVASTGVFAQDDYGYTDSESETTSTPSAPVYTSTPATSSSSMGSSDEGAPKTPIYETVMQNNPASDLTVADYLQRPHLIGENQYMAVTSGGAPFSPLSAGSGFFALNGMGLNWVGGYSTINRAQRIQAGIGTELFGAGIIYQLDKVGTDLPPQPGPILGTTGKSKIVFEGDAFGLFGSFNLNGLSLFGNVAFVTGPGNYLKNEPKASEPPLPVAPTAAPEYELKTSSINAQLGCGIEPGDEGDHSLFATLTFEKASSEDNTSPTKLADSGYMQINLDLNHGVSFKKAEEVSVFGGAGLGIAYRSGSDDAATNTALGQNNKEYSIVFFNLAPNMALRRYLGKGFDVSLGAAINLLTWGSFSQTAISTVGAVASEAETKTSSIHTIATGGNVNMGLTWTKGRFALEGLVNTPILEKGPDFISGSDAGTPAVAMFAQVGLVIGF